MLVWSVKESKPWCAMAFPGRREERAQRRLTSSPSGKKAALQKGYRSTILQRKRNKRHTRSFHLNYDQKRANSVDRMMALRSHCRLGLGVKPSAMSPTLQLSTFIKRLQTPPHTHWQDSGWLYPFVQWSFVRIKCVSSVFLALCGNKSVILCKKEVQRVWCSY